MATFDQKSAASDTEGQVLNLSREVVLKKKDNTLFPVNLIITKMKEVGPDKSIYIATIRDLTQEKKAHAALVTDKIISNVLPRNVVERVKKSVQETSEMIADYIPSATVFFADIVGFTELSSRLPADRLVFLLNRLFTKLDNLLEEMELYKVKTIGDCYMAAGGVTGRLNNHAERMVEFGLKIVSDIIPAFNQEHDTRINFRVGINTGPVIAGVIDFKKFSFDIWGDAVNIASRMESTGIPGKVHISNTTYDQIKDLFDIEERGMTYCKGKGDIRTYIVNGKL